MVSLENLVERWFGLTGYPASKTKKVFSFDYGSHLDEYDICRRNELIEKTISRFHSEELICCLLKNVVEKFLTQTRITLREFLETDCSPFVNFYKDYKEFDFVGQIGKLVDKLEIFYRGKVLLGSLLESEGKIVECAVEVLENFDKLHTNTLRKSSLPVNAASLKYVDRICIYKSLYDCSLEICNFEDGIYLAYIENEDFEANGFFTFVLKSNGNLISVNDRLIESYIGQHSVQSQRNFNFVEDKNWTIFPYGIFKEGRTDCKGNQISYGLKSGDIVVSDLDLDSSLRIYLAMFLVAHTFSGKTASGEIVFSTAYLNEGETSRALIKSDTALALSEEYARFKANLKVREKDVCEYYHGVLENGVTAGGGEPTSSEILFGEWFEESMLDDVDCRVLAAAGEFVGTARNLGAQLTFQAGTLVREKIKKNMIGHMIARGYGLDAVLEYRRMLKERKERVLDFLRNCSEDNLKACLHIEEDRRSPYWVWSERSKLESDSFLFNSEELSRSENDNVRDEKGECKIILWFRPKSYRDIMAALGIGDIRELPKEIRGWTLERNSCPTNSILSIHNPYDKIQNPYYCLQYYGEENPEFDKKLYYHYSCHYNIVFPFEFAMLFSKRRFRRFMKIH